MSRVNTNVSSVIAHANLQRTQKDLTLRLERLSTGLRINRAGDDPAGLIKSERIRSDIAGIEQGIKNSERASSVISTTEGSLNEVSDLLNSIKALIVESANSGGSSKTEREANQLQIDSALDSITRISNTAKFGGLRLLNGGLDYQLSGVRSSAISIARINAASFLSADTITTTVDVVQSAQVGGLYYNGATTPSGVTLSAMTLEIRGPDGVEVIEIPSGQPLSSLVNAVNNVRSLTGVEASLINASANSGMVFRSREYGDDAFVSVSRLRGPQDPADDAWDTYRFDDGVPIPGGSPFDWGTLIGSGDLVTAVRDSGQDVGALINGTLATGDGLKLSLRSPLLGMDLRLTEDFATRPAAASSVFTITGGGTLFQLGPEVTALQQSFVGIPSVAASSLGATERDNVVHHLSSLKSGQVNSIEVSLAAGDFTIASEILENAIDEISTLRGRLGAFERNVLDTNVRSLQSAYENLTASNSIIRDADFATETAALTRAQILAQSGTSMLALAAQDAQRVLQLLQ